MSDYTACVNTTCPSREYCYRYRMVYHERWQSYSGFKFDPKTGECRSFLLVKRDDRVVTVEEADARIK